MAIRLDAHLDRFHRDQTWHRPVRVATTANITIATALNAGDTIDGVTLAAGDRVLVKDQSSGAQNGIYEAGASPARAYDMLAGVQAIGAVVRVLEGTVNGGTWWECTNTSLPTIGTTALTWEEVSFGATPGAVGDADEVHVNEEIVGGPGPNVEADLAELFDAVDWAVDSVGSLTQDGSPQSIINDAFWNEFPGSVRLDARRVLTIYRGLATSHAANGQICGQILTLADDHKSIASIGDRFSILDDAEDLRVEDGVSIVEDQDGVGRLVVPFRFFDGADNHDPSYIICDDLPTDFTEASTWSSPIALPDPGGSVQKYTQGRLRRLSNGTYMLGGGFDSGGDHTVGVWRWTGDLDDPSGATFVTVGSGSNDYSEITFEELPDTTVRALLRSDDNDDIDMKTSADSGATWSSVSNAYDGHGNPMARYFTSGLGLTVYRDAPNGDTAWRPTTDFGATWGSETILSTTGVRSAYATLLQITPNDILCIFAVEHDSGGATGTADLYYDWFRDSSTFAPTLSSAPTGAAGGDLSGTYPNPSVVDDSHNHTSATVPSGVGEILISDTPSTPLVFADLVQNEAQDDLVYADP